MGTTVCEIRGAREISWGVRELWCMRNSDQPHFNPLSSSQIYDPYPTVPAELEKAGERDVVRQLQQGIGRSRADGREGFCPDLGFVLGSVYMSRG